MHVILALDMSIRPLDIRCVPISKYFYCAPTCGSYVHRTCAETDDSTFRCPFVLWTNRNVHWTFKCPFVQRTNRNVHWTFKCPFVSLDQLKCPMDELNISVDPLDEWTFQLAQWTNGHLKMSIGHFTEILDINHIFCSNRIFIERW